MTVRKGDTLWSIAGGDMTRIGQIMEANGLTDSWIYPGETLMVPQKARFSAEEKRHYQAIAQAVFDVDNARLADLGIAVPGGPEVDEPRLRPAVEPEIEVLAEAEEAPAVAEPESDGPQEQAAAEEPEAPQAGEPSLYDLTASAEPDGTAASPTVETAEDETASAALPLVEAEETGEAKQAQAEAAQLEAVEEASPFMSFLEDLGDLGKPIAYGVGATFSPALAKTSLGSKAIGATQSMIMPETGGKTPPEWTTRLGGGFFAL
ncbi:MAG: LysM peptidoglycan-binding domain-containing protein, partial [Hyphomicrobiaceae bacterium]|nr:LysM peptidoglycan-binding domain-containing protein [Hyphomicrobiaceae bacterium]